MLMLIHPPFCRILNPVRLTNEKWNSHNASERVGNLFEFYATLSSLLSSLLSYFFFSSLLALSHCAGVTANASSGDQTKSLVFPLCADAHPHPHRYLSLCNPLLTAQVTAAGHGNRLTAG